jgi:hypothetical protein
MKQTLTPAGQAVTKRIGAGKMGWLSRDNADAYTER